MKNSVWLITAKTNLHVGNENMSSYGLIDKAIQRNALTGLPCINSSSLKGALNEWATHQETENTKKNILDSDERLYIFGVDKTNKKTETQKGSYIFFDANILFLPIQDDTQLYKLATCESVLNSFREKIKLFGIICNNDNTELTDNLKTIMDFRKEIKIISDEEFIELCDDDNLPIIARNKLDNGESKNLWYEQILPQETVFYTLISGKEDGVFEKTLSGKSEIVQIGANATIGYGYCKFINCIFESHE